MYGLLITIGIFVAALVAERLAKKRNKNTEVLWGGLMTGLLFGVVGARLYHVIDFLDFYLSNPLQIFMVWQGGLGIFGGIIFGATGVAIYAKHKKEDLLEWLDIAGLVLPLGQSIGRWGNYFNRELLPYAIYESIANFVLFIILFAITTKWESKLNKGYIFYFYIIGYSTIRFSLERFRNNSWELYSINVAQLMSISLILLSVVLIVKSKKSKMHIKS